MTGHHDGLPVPADEPQGVETPRRIGLTPTQRDELLAELWAGWEHDVPCGQTDPEAWFPDLGQSAHPWVFRLCAGCSARRPCLAAALVGHERGIWAGTAPGHRRALHARLRSGHTVAEVLNDAVAGDSGQVDLDGAA